LHAAAHCEWNAQNKTLFFTTPALYSFGGNEFPKLLELARKVRARYCHLMPAKPAAVPYSSSAVQP
jgi:hypothetical protein